jgi:hypothetical protein
MMYKTLKDRNRWTTFVIGLAAACTLFTIVAAGQAKTDKPLPAASRANLFRDLKEVVSKTVLDDARSAEIAQKWDARKDLAGKTKSQIIDMLWADTKSVIVDSGLRYEIYSMFAFYKRIPDQNFAAKTKKGTASASKPAAVSKLVDLTYQMHPYVGIEEQLAMLPGTPNVKAETDSDRQNRIAGFDEALKANQKLSAEQKEFVRANYDKMITMSDQITESAIRTNFPTETWIRRGPRKKLYERIFAQGT